MNDQLVPSATTAPDKYRPEPGTPHPPMRKLTGLLWRAFDQSTIAARLMQTARPHFSPIAPIVHGISDTSTVLDVGCGRGAFLLGASVVRNLGPSIGVDISDSAISDARKALNRFSEILGRDPPIEFAVCPASSELPRGPFDVVCSIDVLHHVAPQEQKRFFLNLTDRVRPGGVLIIKDMRHRPMIGNLWNRLHDLLVAKQWIHYAPPTRVLRWAVEAGFTPEAHQDYRRFLYFHYLLMLRRPGDDERPIDNGGPT